MGATPNNNQMKYTQVEANVGGLKEETPPLQKPAQPPQGNGEHTSGMAQSPRQNKHNE